MSQGLLLLGAELPDPDQPVAANNIGRMGPYPAVHLAR